jgi:hypothetical protein
MLPIWLCAFLKKANCWLRSSATKYNKKNHDDKIPGLVAGDFGDNRRTDWLNLL